MDVNVRPSRIAALSQKLSRLGDDHPSWRELFEEGGLASASFETRRGCLLHGTSAAIASLKAGTRAQLQHELARNIATHGGDLDRFFPAGVSALFDDALSALNVATAMQGRAGSLRLRIALSVANFTVARFKLQGQERWTLIGHFADRTAAVAASAPAGSIVMDAASHAEVGVDVALEPRHVFSETAYGMHERSNAVTVPAALERLAA